MTPKRITYRPDGLPPPSVGCFLRSSRSTYRIISARRINTRDGSEKYALGVVKVAPAEVPETATVYPLVWDKRAPKR